MERAAPMDDPDDRHVVPVNDLREHDSSRSCWCRPTEDEDERHVLIHHSMDQRELYERGDMLPH